MTRVVLLAESHVYTPEAELDRAIQISDLLPPDMPRGFVRLVYSLAYGEDGSLDNPIGRSHIFRNAAVLKDLSELLKTMRTTARFRHSEKDAY